MERPALQRLLADIDQDLIDVVVVYKVDRLTRSLADFAKMVEVFDAHGISFVAVTQQFNTTTSMGRLTLNVLLSFAQFEREVTGERIRDKIAASKRKGMWMGGVVPVGYDVCDRRIVIDEREAETVRYIFRRYQEVGCVRLLKEDLDRHSVVSKRRTSKTGIESGGHSFSRGALYALLSNPIYVGEIRHKNLRHPGQHQAIVERAVWERTQQQLQEHRVRAKSHAGSFEKSPLIGPLVRRAWRWAYAQSRPERTEKVPLLHLAQLPGPRTCAVAHRLAVACKRDRRSSRSCGRGNARRRVSSA
jgi:site-specific DNA recombinase